MRPTPIRANKCPMRGEAVATANGIAKISPVVPNSANPILFGAFMATTPNTVQPAIVCGHSRAKARRHGTAWLWRTWLFQVPPRRNTKRRVRKMVCVRAMIGASRIMNRVSIATFKTNAMAPL